MLAPKRNENPMQYWISLWPAAPLFGVPWRFEGMMPGAAFFRPSDVVAKMTRASVRETAATVERAAETLEKAAEVVETAAETAAENVVESLAAAAPANSEVAALARAASAPDVAPEPVAAVEQPEPVAAVEQPEPVAAVEQPEPVEQPEAVDEVPVVEPAAVEAGVVGIAPATLYATAPAEVDDLKQIKGVGPKMETMLNGMGIYRFDQIAEFGPEHLAWVSDNLTAFKGRPLSDDWVAQAKALL